MPLEIQFHPLLKTVFAQQSVVHANNFRAFLIHGHCIEVIDFNVFIRTNRMCHRAGVLGKLATAQITHILYSLDRTRMHVRRKFLVPEHCQAFLEGQLEPVPAGHAVTGPVMEILVAYDPFNTLIIKIRRRVGTREHIFGIENVERLVFHRPHVEVIGRDNVVYVQVIFKVKAVFIPFH